jgi:hypothetical protein
MRYVDNEGCEIDKPEWIRPAQSVQDFFATLTPDVVPVAGPLSSEHRAVLEAPSGLDRREMNYFAQNGQGIAEYFKAAGLAASHSLENNVFGKTASGVFTKITLTPFAKIDEDRREVWGVVTEQKPDKDNEVCDFEKSLPYYQAWVDEFKKSTDGISCGNLREMHQLSAVGKGIGFDPRPKEKQIWMGFRIIDDEAWRKVKERVYRGFSHGGEKVGEQVPDPDYPGCMRYVAKPVEISLVDNPCLASATYSLVRADGSTDLNKSVTDMLAQLITKAVLERVAARA